MASFELFDTPQHRNVLLDTAADADADVAHANQYLIVHGEAAVLLDPGGQRCYARVLSEVSKSLGHARLKQIFLSHQDPDVVTSLNAWLMATDAEAHLWSGWTHLAAHFGVTGRVLERLRPIPDEGGRIPIGDAELLMLPAHFLHSAGNFHLYDPVARTLFTGDLGSSDGVGPRVVDEFGGLEPRLEAFHRRYLPHPDVLKPWLTMVRQLDIESIAPQHGSILRGKPAICNFFDWLEGFDCGIATIRHVYDRAPLGSGDPTPQSA